MHLGFQSGEFCVATSDGRNIRMLRPEMYLDTDGTLYMIPMGATSDGGSTPEEAWGPPLSMPPFGEEWRCYVLHDAAFRGVLKKCLCSSFIPANLTETQCNDLLWNALLLCGISRVRAELILTGLRIGGHRAFVEDREQYTPRENNTQVAGGPTGTSETSGRVSQSTP
jgi:hypothetical protein